MNCVLIDKTLTKLWLLSIMHFRQRNSSRWASNQIWGYDRIQPRIPNGQTWICRGCFTKTDSVPSGMSWSDLESWLPSGTIPKVSKNLHFYTLPSMNVILLSQLFFTCHYFWDGSHAIPLQRGLVFTKIIIP